MEQEQTGTAAVLLRRAEENRRMGKHRFFLGYVWFGFRQGGFYRGWSAFLSYLRRFRMIAWVVRIVAILFTFLQTGTLVLLSTVVFLVLLPILLALIIGILLTALIESRRTDRILSGKLAGKRVYLLFWSARGGEFLWENARSLAQDDKNAVLILSPFWLSGKGFSENRFYCTAREDAPSIFLVRRYYFFHLRRKLLTRENCVYVY